MQKILVTTDLSANSRAGLRFAIQLASQNTCTLVFYYACHISIPSSWSILRTGDYEKSEIEKARNKLVLFVKAVYKGMAITQQHTKFVVENSFMPQGSIIDYASNNKFNFICISTRGAGKIARLLGTNTANLINHSAVPVIAVPHNYSTSPVNAILYASDLANIKKELKKVIAFARPLRAKVELLHFTTLFEKIVDSKIIISEVKKFANYDIMLHFKNRNAVESLVADIEGAVKKSKPSLLIMFTEQNRNLFQKLFFSGKSAGYSFGAKVPLLVFNKT